ncbi:hypothetical protein GCM10010275_71430 [Streptomyces litmocidini]|nr:hypothetical protein GCM10010275_71430 [Streptomyces litmocidini]
MSSADRAVVAMTGTGTGTVRGTAGPAGLRRRSRSSAGSRPAGTCAGRSGDRSHTRSHVASGSVVPSTWPVPAGRALSSMVACRAPASAGYRRRRESRPGRPGAFGSASGTALSGVCAPRVPAAVDGQEAEATG